MQSVRSPDDGRREMKVVRHADWRINHIVNVEALWLIERVQQDMASPAYEAGRSAEADLPAQLRAKDQGADTGRAAPRTGGGVEQATERR